MTSSTSSPTLHPMNTGFEWPDRRPPFRVVTPEQAAQFDREGYFLFRDAFPPDVVERLRAEIDPFEEQEAEKLRRDHDGQAGISRADEITFTIWLVARTPYINRLVRSSPLVDLAIDLVGPDVRMYWDQSVYKKPETPRPFPWHQDNGYTFITPQDYLTCWIALTDATVDNGCPWVWPGVHRYGTLAHRPSDLGHVCKEDDTDAVPVEAKAGDIVVFSSLTPHRTGPNTTDSVRKAYIVQYAHADAVNADGSPCADPDRQFPVARDGHPASEEERR